MKELQSIRLLWLLNHTTFRKFEILQLHALGIKEIFLPKFVPIDEANLSVSVDFTEDSNLSIPPQALEVLNNQNWYENPSQEAWDIVNTYFDVAVVGFFSAQIESIVQYFKGSIILRAFGLSKKLNYTQLLYHDLGVPGVEKIMQLKDRFWFGAAFPHLSASEGSFLQQRNCYLPGGLASTSISDAWKGDDKRIMFVCPRINTNDYFNAVYQKFRNDFSEFKYTIGGAQPIEVMDSSVIGFVSSKQHQLNMLSHRVMFYHSSEPNHVHYHPFEAIHAGMPLIFMAGGILDTMGGKNQPGRCLNLDEAKAKIKRILQDDWTFIHTIKKEQTKLLEQLSANYCLPFLKEGFNRVVRAMLPPVEKKQKPPRIAVIVPIPYSGGSLRGAILLANALLNGAKMLGEAVELVFAHLDMPALYTDEKFTQLDPAIQRRAYTWKNLSADDAKTSLSYAGHGDWTPHAAEYTIPDDGINHFLDCDLWVLISDRIFKPLLPIRPYICMVYDYLSRHVPFLTDAAEAVFFEAAHQAKKVLVTTELTAADASHYAGINPQRIALMPMLVPDFLDTPIADIQDDDHTCDYFIWTTNPARHKNHVNAFLALKEYYEDLDGTLECHITGDNTEKLMTLGSALRCDYLIETAAIYERSITMRQKTKFYGTLFDVAYRKKLKKAAFLWHAAQIDNGTFSVIEAAQLQTPSLSSHYPPMVAMNEQFHLNLQWMDCSSPSNMASQLKFMEHNYLQLKQQLKSKKNVSYTHNKMDELSYWKVLKKCL